jgi:hypothetical protein
MCLPHSFSGGCTLNKNQIIMIIKDLEGHLGPFINVRSMEDFNNLRINSYNAIGSNSLDILLDILANPPREEVLKPTSFDDFKCVLIEMLSVVGKRDMNKFLDSLNILISQKSMRLDIIDILGDLKNASGINIIKTN